MTAVRDRLEEFGQTKVVLITFSTSANIAAYQSVHGVAFAVLIDRDRRAYRDYGIGRGSIRRVWGLRSAQRYLEILRTDAWRKGVRAVRAMDRTQKEDTLQLGANFIVAPDGTLAYAFWSEGPDDRPSVDELLGAVHSIGQVANE